ncbi:transient receptor potential cation channel subfamily V member 5-like isoform X2 [Ptychodera flava]|uniref:transient receptor potential cation channel subfamily V member 5-like isoform X2 n=1 Tax=Ptychodera flava TaxID=63121 RepID=UPI00396A4706
MPSGESNEDQKEQHNENELLELTNIEDEPDQSSTRDTMVNANGGPTRYWKRQYEAYDLYKLTKLDNEKFLKLYDQHKTDKIAKDLREILEECFSPTDEESREMKADYDWKDLDRNAPPNEQRKGNMRGDFEQTVFHVCCLESTKSLNRVVKVFSDVYPEVVLFTYEKEKHGLGFLHLAVMNNDLETVKMLIENGANVDRRAIGSFLKHKSRKDSLSVKCSDYFEKADYGEYPIHFAASFGYVDIYNYLIQLKKDEQVDQNTQDSHRNRNTALHMAAIYNRLEICKIIMNNKTRPLNLSLKNEDDLTVFEIVCKDGRGEIFNEMLKYRSKTLYEFGPVQCVSHPLEEVDSITKDGKLDTKSALRWIVFGDPDDHLDLIEDGVIYHLIKEKWDTFAKKKLQIHFFLALIHLIAISTAVYLRPDGDLLHGMDVKSIVRYVAESIVLFACIIYLAWECCNIAALKARYWKLMRFMPERSVFLLSCILFLLCLPLRLLSQRYLEDHLMTVAIPLAYSYMLFFFRGTESLGPSVVTIHQMAIEDVWPFILLWITIISILCPVFFFPYKDMNGIESFGTFYGSWMYLFHMTFDEFEILISGLNDELELSRRPIMTGILFAVFMLFIPILFRNMLIAKMTQSNHKIEERAGREWILQKARLIMVLEHSCSQAELRKYRKHYATAAEDVSGTLACVNRDPKDNGDSLTILRPTPKARLQKKIGSSSARERLSLQHWKVIPKAKCKQPKRQHAETTEQVRGRWGQLVEKLPGSALENGITEGLFMVAKKLDKLSCGKNSK